MDETAAARAAGMHRLLRIPAAEVIALHFAMATKEITEVCEEGGGGGGRVEKPVLVGSEARGLCMCG